MNGGVERILFISHSDFGVPDYIQSWVENKKISLSICCPYRGESLPGIGEVDFIILTGGTQSLFEQDKYPFLKDEIQFLKEALAANKKILGICLGAQLLGEAHGEKTVKSPYAEIGVFPITLTSDGLKDSILEGIPSTFLVTHWHRNMPGVPNTASVLAVSEGCPRQIVRYSKKVYGFQCHIDVTLGDVQKAICMCENDFISAKYIQNKDEFLLNDFSAINRIMISILEKFIHLE